MNENEFEHVMGKAHQDYIEGMARAQNISLEEATRKADKQVQSILKDGYHTENHLFYGVEFKGEFAGLAWIEIKDEGRSAWGYNIYVEEKFRRQGIAKKVFQELGAKLKSDGVQQMSFHVYADNPNALALYEQFGFKTTNIVMRKTL